MTRKNSIPLYATVNTLPEVLLIFLCAASLLVGSDRAYLTTVICFSFTILRTLDRLVIPLTRYYDNKAEREHEERMALLTIQARQQEMQYEYVMLTLKTEDSWALPVPDMEEENA